MADIPKPIVSKKKADFLTRLELEHAFRYINKKIEEVGGPPDFFTFGKVMVPDVEELAKAKRKFYLREFRSILEEKKKEPKFRNYTSIALLHRIQEGKDLTIPLMYFTKEEKEDMERRGFPVKFAEMGMDMSIFTDFKEYLETKTRKKLDKDFVNFIMTYISKLSDVRLLSFFAFDDIKKKELELIKSVKTVEFEGIRFGTNTDFKMSLECSFRNPIIMLPEAHYDSLTLSASNYLDDMTIFDLFNALVSSVNLQVGEKNHFIESSIDKEWSKKYFEYKEKDAYFLDIAINSLDGYQESKILLK